MNKIEIYRTKIVINNYDLGSCARLENCFKMYDPITHQEYYHGIEYIPERKQLLLPRGIDLFFVENIFECKAVSMEQYYDEFDTFNDIQIKYLPRDEDQQEALKFMVGKDRYRRNQYLSQLSVNLNTGKGKTYCSIATASYFGMKTIIITYSTKWLEQWRDFILEYTNTTQDEICMMIGGSKIARTLKEDNSKYKFILVTHSSLVSYANNNGWSSIGELFKQLRIGLKFYDESHLNFKSMAFIDYYTNTFKTYYITATPMRSNEYENMIFQLYMKNIPAIDLFHEDTDPHTNYLAIKYNSRPSVDDICGCKNKYGLDRNKYTNYIVHNEKFYQILTILMQRIINHGGKTLIYIGTIYGIEVVYNWIVNNYPEFSYNTCILNSNIEDKTIIDRCQIILSTTKSTGASIDIKYLKRTIVLAEPFKSEVLARQTLGRTRNGDTEYIEVVDKGFTMITKWFNEKKHIFNKYALSCKIINLNDKDLLEAYSKIYEYRMNRFVSPPRKKPMLHYTRTKKKLRYHRL